MQTQSIVLIPPSDEQAWPSFHVEESLLEDFLSFLGEKGVKSVEPPEPLGNLGPKGHALFELEIEEEHKVPELEKLLQEFIQSHGGTAA